MAPDHVQRDAVEPSSHLGGPIERVELAFDDEKHVLRDVFTVEGGTTQPVRQSINEVEVIGVKLFELEGLDRRVGASQELHRG